MLNEDQRMQMMYTGLCICFSTERNIGWSRSNMLVLVNGAGTSLLTAQHILFLTVQLEIVILRYIVVVIGLLICAFWLIANYRTQQRINYWQGCLAKTEPVETYLLVFRVFTTPKWRKIIEPLPFVPYAMNMLPLIFLMIWLSVFLFLILVPRVFLPQLP